MFVGGVVLFCLLVLLKGNSNEKMSALTYCQNSNNLFESNHEYASCLSLSPSSLILILPSFLLCQQIFQPKLIILLGMK
jgi:hypothetical protein